MDLHIQGPAQGLHGRLQPPGDKSITHRALLFGAMSNGASRLRGCLRSGVTDSMLNCLKELGVETEFLQEDDLIILGRKWRSQTRTLHCGNSGTTMRLLLGAVASSEIRTTIDGSPQLRRRPMQRILDPLRRMGAMITIRGEGSAPPFEVEGRQLHGITFDLPVPSAQVKSGILLAALSAQGPTKLSEPLPSRDHTERILKNLGVSLSHLNGTIKLTPHPEPLPNFTIRIPGDASSAAFLMVAALLVPDSEVTLFSVGLNPTRTGLLTAFENMGANIQRANVQHSCGEPMGDIIIRSSHLHSTAIQPEAVVSMIDEFPIFAVAATQAEGDTIVRGAKELRFKESDRIRETSQGLRRMGARIQPRPDGFVVEGPTALHGADLDPQGDHRVAMAFAVAGLLAEGETILRNADCISQSYPAFVADMRKLGAKIH
jgi:3-phosphoshikimate 1-carboxyvinyltransferase